MNNYVCSYINPDLDGIACSIALAKLLGNFTPVYFGEIDCETEYVLKKLNIEYPAQVNHLNDAEKIALVDTHHILQLDKNLPIDKVILIYDHHPNGDTKKFINAHIINKPIGAAASLIAEQYLDQELDNAKMLQLLAMAIVSNTQNFTSSSTSEFDRQIFEQITSKYDISQHDITEMMHSRANILKRGLRPAILADVKKYQTKEGVVGISQLTIPGLSKILQIENIKPILNNLATELELDYFLLNAGDPEDDVSIVISANQNTTDLLIRHFDMPFENGWQKFDRLLYRKKDFLFD